MITQNEFKRILLVGLAGIMLAGCIAPTQLQNTSNSIIGGLGHELGADEGAVPVHIDPRFYAKATVPPLSDGTFTEPASVLNNWYTPANGWTMADQPRLLGDVNGDGKADIVGFATDGTYLSLGTGSSFPAGTKLQRVQKLMQRAAIPSQSERFSMPRGFWPRMISRRTRARNWL